MTDHIRVPYEKKRIEDWSLFNPVLLDGEPIAVELADGEIRFKVGDGVKSFSELPYVDYKVWDALETKLSATFSADDADKVLGIDSEGNVVPVSSLKSKLNWGDVIETEDSLETSYTANLNLTLPGYEDPLDIRDLNENFTIIDDLSVRVDSVSDSVSELDTEFTDASARVDTIESDVTVVKQDMAQVVSDQDALDARIDNLFDELTANPDYSVANAEVIDIRTGYDGTRYASAGAAVRALGEELEEIRGSLQTINPDDLGLEQDEVTKLVYPTFKGVRSIHGIPLAGGSGGGGGNFSTIITLRSNIDLAFTAALGQQVFVDYRFSSVDINDQTPTGNGTASYYINDKLVLNTSIEQAASIKYDVTAGLVKGTNTVKVRVSDVEGNTRELTWTINVAEISVTSKFDYTVDYVGSFDFIYTVNGKDIEKVVYFYLDGKLYDSIPTKKHGQEDVIKFSDLKHGLHTLEVYAEATVNGSLVKSNTLKYDVIVTEEGNFDPIIAINYDATSIYQGSQLIIPYRVVDPAEPSGAAVDFEISYVENSEIKIYYTDTKTVPRGVQEWSTRDYPLGEVTFTIRVRDTKRSITLKVTEFKLPIEIYEYGLELHLSAAGRSNLEDRPDVWSYNDITTTFNDVNWSASGWVADTKGDTALHLTGGSTATINYYPFKGDVRTTGKTLEFEFAVRDVNNRNANVISCMSNGIGFNITADSAIIQSDISGVESPSVHFGDGRRIRLSFVIQNLRNEDRLVFIYIDGVMTSVYQYTADLFTQKTPVPITVGSPYCSVDLYSVRCYATSLRHQDALANYICELPDLDDRSTVYEANNIYDDDNEVAFDKVRNLIPTMTIVGALPAVKGDKQRVDIYYENPLQEGMDFIFNDPDPNKKPQIDIQGTSSVMYNRKNYKIKFPKAISHIEGEIATKTYCMKADYAEGTSTHNTGNANIAHTLYSEPIPPQEKDPRCRTTIEGFPCVIFYKENASAEPQFFGKYNFNYDKGSEEAFGFTDEYDVESWEFCQNNLTPCLFLDNIPEKYHDVVGNSDLGWAESFERRYPDHDLIEEGDEDPTQSIARFKRMHDWVVSTKDLDVESDEIVRVDPVYDENGDPVYKTEDGVIVTDKNGLPIQETVSYTARDIYRKEFLEFFNLHYCLVYYVWTFFFLMTDQRAKNMFLTYWGNTGKWYPYLYDNDTCLGINNEGEMVFDYYHEDTDYLPNGQAVYNGQRSVLWNKFRVAFANEIKTCYQDLRRNGKLTYDVVHQYFIDNQSKRWSEAMYNEDSNFKYIIGSKEETDSNKTYFYQVRGTGEHHLEYFVKSRLAYCDSKWEAMDYKEDIIGLRINTPEVVGSSVTPNPDITVTPYSHMYASIQYGANGTPVPHRLKEGEAYTFKYMEGAPNDLEVLINGASQISSIGNMAPLYCTLCDFSKAIKLREVILGSDDPNYKSMLAKVSFGSNTLLEYVNLKNCKSLATAIDLSKCINLEEVYADGSSVTNIKLPDSGYLKVLHLPATTTLLSIKNQHFINDFIIEGYDSLTRLHLENTPNLPVNEILLNAKNLNYVRLVNVEWETTEEELDQILEILATTEGMDENGEVLVGSKPVVSGLVKLPSLTDEKLAMLNDTYPELMVSVSGKILCTVTFYNFDSSIIATRVVEYGTAVTDPLDEGVPTPVRPQTDDNQYEFRGWSRSLENITRSTAIVAMYNVKYAVKFKLDDTNVLYKEYVTEGTVVSDPIGNHIVEPSMPSTERDEFTFVGWDRDLTIPITEVTEIKAVFESHVRSYEIRFYNEDYLINNTVAPLEIQVLEHGTYPQYNGATPVKLNVEYPEDYTFLGWNPPIESVKGDAVYIAKFSESDHITDDWATVADNALNGSYKDKYPIGSRQRIPLTTGEVVEVELVGYDHDIKEDGTKAKMSFIALIMPDVQIKMYDNTTTTTPSFSTKDGWRDSEMRYYLSETFYKMLPSDLTNVITPVVKTGSIGGSNAAAATDVQTTVDKLWIPALVELGDSSKLNDAEVYRAEGTPYEIFNNLDYWQSNNMRIKYYKNYRGVYEADDYWTRTPVTRSSTAYIQIGVTGEPSGFLGGNTARAVAFGFCIG